MLLIFTLSIALTLQYCWAIHTFRCLKNASSGHNQLALGATPLKILVFLKTIDSKTVLHTTLTSSNHKYRPLWPPKVVLSVRATKNPYRPLSSETLKKNQGLIAIKWKVLISSPEVYQKARHLVSAGNIIKRTIWNIAVMPMLSFTLRPIQALNIKVRLHLFSPVSPRRQQKKIYCLWKTQNVLREDGRGHKLGPRTLSSCQRQIIVWHGRNERPQLCLWRKNRSV